MSLSFHVLTLFPEMIVSGMNTSITGRAIQRGLLEMEAVNIRDFAEEKRKSRIDDYPYGGGAGMVMQAEPVYRSWKSVCERIGCKIRTIALTPQGKVFTQKDAVLLAKEEHLIFLCGHYEGIDERVLEEIVTDSWSIGDYVLTGGELPAMVMMDAISRMVPGVLTNVTSGTDESFSEGLLEYPQYTRPEIWHDRAVPPILLSGDHRKVDEWRRRQSLKHTLERRPDLLDTAPLTGEDRSYLGSLAKTACIPAENMIE